MGLRINTNVQSLRAQTVVSRVEEAKSNALMKLSSGSRINKAGDDAAGLAISEKLKAEIRSSNQAKRNAGDGISMIQVAEGGLNETSNILVRLKELSVQAASDTIGEQERKFTDMEFQNLSQEIARIADSTKYSDRQLLTGEGSTLEFQIGTTNNAATDRLSYRPQDSSAKPSDLGIDGMNVLTKGDAQTNLEKIDMAISSINGNRAMLGALQNRLQTTISNIEVKTENLSEANSRVRDADIAQESATLAKNNILSAASTSVLAQANNSGSGALKLIS